MRGLGCGAKRRRSGFSTERSNCRDKESRPWEKSLWNKPKNMSRTEKEGNPCREGKYIKTLFWNVAGTAKLKAEDWDYLKGFDIIGLVETWEEPDRVRRSDLILDGFEVRVKHATRDKKKGRAKGGMC